MTKSALLNPQTIIDCASVIILSDPIRQTIDDSFSVCPGTSISEWLAESGYDIEITKTPTLLLLNSEPLLEARFDTRLNAGDILTLVQQPGDFGLTFWIAVAISVASAAYSIYLASSLDTGLDDTDEKSQNTDISYRGNSAKIGAARPQVFGTFRTFPDLAAQPYSEFDSDGDEQLFMLLEVTEGYASCSEFEFDGTPLTNFSDYNLEVLEPGEQSKIFPSDVFIQAGAENLELTPAFTSAFVASETGQDIVAAHLDFTLPEGVYIINSLGDYKYHQVLVVVQWRLAGTSDAWEEYQHLFTESWHPIRYTLKIPFTPAGGRTPGRYEFKCRRQIADSESTTTMEKVFWTGLRGFIPSTRISTSTQIALSVRSSDQIGSQALTKFSTLVERKLPIWNGASWSAETLTNSGIWAFCEVLRSSGRRTDEYIDLAHLKSIADSDTTPFNGVFDSTGTEKGALDEIAAIFIGRAIELPGNIYTMVIDELGTPSRMFTSRNIVEGSFELNHIFPGTETYDSVDVTFFDENQGYREVEISCVPPGSAGANPKKLKLRGATHVFGAARVGFRMAAENAQRRDTIKFSTGIEGYLVNFGDTIRIQSYELGRLSSNNAVSGDIVSYNGTSTITVAEDISAHTSGHVFILNLDGSPQGPFACTVSGQSITITESFDDSCLTFPDDLVRPTFALGAVSDFMINMKVTNLTDTGDRTYGIEGFIDHPSVYTPGIEPAPTTLPPRQDLWPIIADLRVNLYGETDNPYIKLTWSWSNCDYAKIEQSIDGGATWDLVGRAMEPSYTVVPPITATLLLRVSGVSLFTGWPVTTGNINTTGYVLSPAPIRNLKQSGDFADVATISFDAPEPWLAIAVNVWWTPDGGVATKQRVRFLPPGTVEFSYSSADAISDDPDFAFGVPVIKNGARALTFEVFSVSSAWFASGSVNDISEPAYLAMTNDQVVSLSNVTYTERSADLGITFTLPDSRDFLGAFIHIAEYTGFVPDASNLVNISNSNNISLTGVLAPNSTYYLRMAGVDVWGSDNLNYSAEAQIQTSDDVLSGSIIWDNVTGDNKPEDFATFSGLASAVVDPRFDLSAAGSSFAPYWHTQGGGVALSSTGGEDGGPCAVITSNASDYMRLYPGDGRPLPAAAGTRFQARARIKRSSAMLASLNATELDKDGNILFFADIKTVSQVAVGTWGAVEGAYTVQSSDCRGVHIGAAVGPWVASGETLYVDDLNIWAISPKFAGDNADEYFEDSALDTRELRGGSVFVADVVDVAADTSFTTLTPGSAGAWSAWFPCKEFEVDYLGRKDGQPLILAYFNQSSLEIKNTNASTIAGCEMQMRLVRDDDDTVAWYFIDDPLWSWTFTMPVTPGVPYQYGTHILNNPWSVYHGLPERSNMVDLTPPNGLVTYRLEWRLKTPTALSGLEHKPGAGRTIVMGGKA